MIKKIFIVLIFFSILLSCGKKADPEYKANKKSILINKL